MAVVTQYSNRTNLAPLILRNYGKVDQAPLPKPEEVFDKYPSVPTRRQEKYDTASFTDLFSKYGPFSPKTAIVGICEDGFPLLLDFSDSAACSILVNGGKDSGITTLLSFLLASVSSINTPEEVNFSVISANPSNYYPCLQSPNCAGLHHNRAPEVKRLISDYISQDGLDGTRSSRLLVIDDLADFIYGLDEESFWGFTWLVHNGAQNQVWVIASQEDITLSWIDRELLDVFPTRVYANGCETPPYQESNPLLQYFHVPYQDNWFSVRRITRCAK